MRRLVIVSVHVEIRALEGLDDMQALLRCFQQVWTLTPEARPLSTELLLALRHAGNPVLGAFHGGDLVGASVGVTGVRPDGATVLHSHMTGVLTGEHHRGVGRRLKWAQRDWARAHGVARIEWTFDPLVRRNGWFNLMVLGATAPEYLVDFYGPIDDGINAGDETDRLLAVWDVTNPTTPVTPEPGDMRVATPPDIVALRRTHPREALAWRQELRRHLTPRLADGWVVVGMTHEGDYLVRHQG